MGLRKILQSKYRDVRDGANSIAENARNNGGRTVRAMDIGKKGVTRTVRTVSKVSGNVVDRSTRLIGLDRYRLELEAALDEAMRVIATQEARIARLEEDFSGPRP